ncbi:MAG: TetR/AcrR family transcriptional regulator [Lachnospiraceae bacterium]
MNETKMKENNILEPSRKVRKMYEAIAEFVREERDIGKLTVSDITSRAGIGKGTAYEYFSSKEELIAQATLWISFHEIRRMTEKIERIGSFREKFYSLFDWMEDHREYNEMLMRAAQGNANSFCELKSGVPKEFLLQVRQYVTGKVNELLEQGIREGLFTQQDEEKRTLIFFGTMMQYFYGMVSLREGAILTMDQEELKAFIYECMIRSLSE